MDSIFDLEVREKRNQAFLNKARTGSKGGSKSRKGMNTPFDYMNKTEKRKLNGEVQTVMYETILTKEEFELKDDGMQKLMLARWRELYDNEKIRKEMGYNNKSYYDLVKLHGLTGKRGGYKKRKAKATALEEIKEVDTQINVSKEKQEEPKPLLISRGLHLEYNGEYNAEQLSKIFTKLQLLTDGEENKFNLAISLSERA